MSMDLLSHCGIAVLALAGLTSSALAQDVALNQTSEQAMFVSPYYFGPNAFPIPDILNKTSDKMTITLAGDYYWGKTNNTTDVLLKTHIPLWTERANLSLWWPVYEWYKTPHSKGGMSGDIYVSIDLQLLKERAKMPSWTLRAALKTASGGGYDIQRYYDSAGYFFDSYVGKTFPFGQLQMQVCAGGGFLCWQTDNGRQNDAIQYGLYLGLLYAGFNLSGTYSGYCGWQSNSKIYGHLVHDRPMSIKIKLSYALNQWELFAMAQHGLKDYPYTQLQFGVTYSLDFRSRW